MKEPTLNKLTVIYQRYALFVLLGLGVAVLVLSFFPGQSYVIVRESVIIALVLAFIPLIFDVINKFDRILKAVESAKNEVKLDAQIKYNGYLDLLPKLLNICRLTLESNKDLTITVKGVAAQFSWKQLVEDQLRSLLKIGNCKQVITINLLILQGGET